jgi:hypothetical protein
MANVFNYYSIVLFVTILLLIGTRPSNASSLDSSRDYFIPKLFLKPFYLLPKYKFPIPRCHGFTLSHANEDA